MDIKDENEQKIKARYEQYRDETWKKDKIRHPSWEGLTEVEREEMVAMESPTPVCCDQPMNRGSRYWHCFACGVAVQAEYKHPTIRKRHSDWCAYEAGNPEFSPKGSGASEREAVEELLQKMGK